MADISPNLDLPFLLPAQAQKHVTHNEALERLDLFVQMVVQGFGATTPPRPMARSGRLAPRRWPIGPGRRAGWLGGAWVFIDPREGWRAWSLAEAQLRVWRGTEWQALPLDQLDGIGIGTAYDGTNRLAVVSPATLLTHDGAGHQLKINKAAEGDTASLLYQTNWSGRAEMGLAGNDDFSVKVSADGGTWAEALRINRSTGATALLAGAMIGGQTALHRGNLLGTVSQTAGIPTGAVMERGSNASGEYVRFADGTQICVTPTLTVDLTTGSGGLFTTSAIQQAIMPADFVSTVGMVGMVCGINTENAWGVARTLNTTTLNWRSWRTTSVVGQQFRLMALGRWF